MLTAPHFTPKFPTAQWTLPAVLEHQAIALAGRPFLRWDDDTPFLSFESDARTGRNVLATLNAISQAVLHQFRLRTAPEDAPNELPTHALAA